MRRLRRWFWRQRDHGYRLHGTRRLGRPARSRWGGDCARCGGYEYGEPRHPRGFHGPDGWLR